MMISHEEYVEMTQEVEQTFSLQMEKYHENIRALRVPTMSDELLRIVYDKENEVVEVAFHVETVPSDAIQIFSYVQAIAEQKGKEQGVKLLHCFYRDDLGSTFTGPEAKAAYEQAMEDKFIKEFSKLSKDERERAIARVEEKNKKITWH